MMTKRVMLLGAAGQVGLAVQAAALPSDWTFKALSRAECDILDGRAVQAAMRDFAPDLIINSAAMTNVDQCEKEEDLAMSINFEAAANIAAQCASTDTKLIHVSTDYVFDGTDGAIPYVTDAPMNPLNVYGYSKMMGEEAVRHELAWHCILRISSVFSAFGTNLLTKTLQMLDKHDALKMVTDQLSCPTPAQDVASGLIRIAEQLLTGRADAFGTFHLAGAEPSNRLDFVRAVMESYAPYTARRPNIEGALSSDFPGFAKRPGYSVLDCSKTEQRFGVKQRPWRAGLAEAMAMLMSNRSRVS